MPAAIPDVLLEKRMYLRREVTREAALGLDVHLQKTSRSEDLSREEPGGIVARALHSQAPTFQRKSDTHAPASLPHLFRGS